MTQHHLAIDLATARAELDAGRAMMIDIRESDEHAMGVAPGATLIPMSELGERLGEVPQDPQRPVLLICRTQNRSAQVAQALEQRGWKNLRYIVGGMSMWELQGWPMVAPGDAADRGQSV
jgi:rhodanese-related sulfurtransferase